MPNVQHHFSSKFVATVIDALFFVGRHTRYLLKESAIIWRYLLPRTVVLNVGDYHFIRSLGQYDIQLRWVRIT